ncbi:MAG: GerMN domain-containing protein [Negativicutes bacterium]|nr:GerMN domain-containing protein [Negativicutes bacterium]
MKKTITLLLLLMLCLTGCNRPNQLSASVDHVFGDQISLYGEEDPEYLHTTESAKVKQMIAYRLFSNGNRFWYYAVTEETNSSQPLHVQAVNATLTHLCQALGLPSVEVASIAVRDKIAYLDLPDSFTAALPSFSAVKSVGDALVMTLTEFKSINKVQFLLDGQNSNFLSRNSAQYEINLPLSRPEWPNEETVRQESKTVVYWLVPETDSLVPITVRLPNTDDSIMQTLVMLLEGPAAYASSLQASVLSNPEGAPARVYLRNFAVKDRTAILDLDFGDYNFAANQAQFELAIKAIVQTLTEFPAIEKVQFLLNGERVALAVGQMNTGDQLERLLYLN